MRKTDNALSWLRSNRFPSALLIPGLPQQHTGDDQMFVLRPNDGQVFHNPEAVKEMTRSEKLRVASKIPGLALV